MWNNPNLDFDFNHQRLKTDDTYHIIPISVHKMDINSLANRWFISRSHDFQTSSVIVIDDDMFINEFSIKCMLETFLMNPTKIISPSHTHLRTTRQLEKAENGWSYVNDVHTTAFNMLLPGMSMFNTAYLHKLADALEEYELLPIINDQAAHCDDISMMLSMAMLNEGKRYLLGIDYILITDYSEFRKQAALTDSQSKAGLFRRYGDRSECLTMIVNKFMTINEAKGTYPINPIVTHDRRVDSYNCHECEHCDARGCWFKESADPVTKRKVQVWENKRGIRDKHTTCDVPMS